MWMPCSTSHSLRSDNTDANPTFTLSYNGNDESFVLPTNPNDDVNFSKADQTLRKDARIAYVKEHLEAIDGIDEVSVAGAGTHRDPWRIEIIDGVKDNKGNFLKLETTDTGIISDPMDIADAAATTAPSISLSSPDDYQRVYYDFSAEAVEIHGGLGDDTIISDDSMAPTYVYGDQGNDNFLVGRVIETITVTVDVGTADERQIEAVDGEHGITAGVSFNGEFFGGTGDDYFEVNHNVGQLELYGESGDDTFFLRAHLTTDGTELDGESVTAGAGDKDNNIEESDQDVLLNYVQNNRVLINGGSGFDTVVLAGTALEDEFYIFTDTTGKQYIFGAGLKIEGVSNVERLAILSGGDDDKIYLYGLNEELELLINTGSGNDEVILGGDQVDFEVVYPESSAVYTVEKKVLEDETVGDADLDFNDIVFNKRELGIAEIQEQFRLFFAKWVNPEASDEHIASVE